jgi:hypothetical protein
VRLPGGTGRLQGHPDGAPPLQGEPEAIAETLRGFAAEGIALVQLVLDPITRDSIEALAPMLEALDRGHAATGSARAMTGAA